MGSDHPQEHGAFLAEGAGAGFGLAALVAGGSGLIRWLVVHGDARAYNSISPARHRRSEWLGDSRNPPQRILTRDQHTRLNRCDILLGCHLRARCATRIR